LRRAILIAGHVETIRIPRFEDVGDRVYALLPMHLEPMFMPHPQRDKEHAQRVRREILQQTQHVSTILPQENNLLTLSLHLWSTGTRRE
jgi:hypothetical protein